MAESSTFRTKTCNYLIDDSHENRKAQGTRKCAIKQKFKFEDYKNCLVVAQLKNKLNQREKNKVNEESLRKNY